MNLNTENWKPFKVEDLFYKLENGKANQSKLGEGDECFYIGAKRNDNGVMFRCAYDETLVQKGNCIIFICNGEGSVGYANYMSMDFIGTTDIVAGYNEHLNEYTGVFIATIASLERPKFSYGRKWKKFLKKTKLFLPVNSYGNPDWNFMENYIKSLHYKPLTTRNKAGQAPNLNAQDWKKFKIGDLFTVDLAKGDIQLGEVDSGNIPLVSSGETNNGIIGYIAEYGDGKSELFLGNQITVDMFCNAFYQPNPFFAVSHGRVNILTPKFNMTEKIAFFITTLIKQEQYKYSYGRAVYSKCAENMEIRLPVNDRDKPDWQFMEDYIKSLPYGDRI